jgi:hypothetical protein
VAAVDEDWLHFAAERRKIETLAAAVDTTLQVYHLVA